MTAPPETSGRALATRNPNDDVEIVGSVGGTRGSTTMCHIALRCWFFIESNMAALRIAIVMLPVSRDTEIRMSGQRRDDAFVAILFF